jgi:phytoene/squalene synthetase
MNKNTSQLAHAITFASSKQTYYTARLLVDKDLVDDCLRAYAYLRWVDDVIDIEPQSKDERITFIERQIKIVDQLFRNERPAELCPQELLIAAAISNNRSDHNGLYSFIWNFLQVLEFDARRKDRLISQSDLTWYSQCLGKSVTDGIQYFIGNHRTYPDTGNRYLAATGAHITHMLRDMYEDLGDGFVNIPKEYLESRGFVDGITSDDLDHQDIRAWVREQVDLARAYIKEGKTYLNRLELLRCKIAGYWYCARFEVVLNTIERDGYSLRPNYNERGKIASWFKIASLGAWLTLNHMGERLRHQWRFYQTMDCEKGIYRMIERN